MRKTSKPKRVASRPKFAGERQYRDALAETNQLLLGKKIYDAQQALLSRLREMEQAKAESPTKIPPSARQSKKPWTRSRSCK